MKTDSPLGMRHQERLALAIILLAIMGSVVADLLTDARQGAPTFHLAVEGAVALAALGGLALLVRGAVGLRRTLASERQTSHRLRQEAEQWRNQSAKHIAGLSQAIDQQLTAWKLTPSEKEVAFLLLKGLSLKEIAEVRHSAEKTVRIQAMTLYGKAGLNGRSELAAFFLEDLFAPLDTTTPALPQTPSP